MQEYENYIDNIYEWVEQFTTFEVIPAKKNIDEDHEKFVSIDFGLAEEDGLIKANDFIKNEDTTLTQKIVHKYKQKVELEFYGEGADYEALKVQQSIAISSSIPFLKNISILNGGMTNTTMAVGDDYEERYLLSLFVYFSIGSDSNNIESIKSINFTGNIKGVNNG